MRKLKVLLLLGLFSFVALSLITSSGCSSKEQAPEEEVYTIENFKLDQYKELTANEKLNLLTLIDMAIAKNLPNYVSDLEKQVANEKSMAKLYADLVEIMPKSDVTSGQVKLFSDFALVFYNNRRYNVMNKEDMIQRAKENIAAETTAKYVAVAVNQKEITAMLILLEDCRSRYKLIEELKKSRQITPFRANVEVKRFFDMEQSLKKYAEEFKKNSKTLAYFANYQATEGKYLAVNDAILNRAISDKTLSLKEFEAIALVQRRELAHLNRIKLIEEASFADVAKNLLTQSNSNNIKFGLQSVYNLVEFKEPVSRFDAYFTPAQVEFDKRTPLVNNVIANVKINFDDMQKAKQEFANAATMFSDSEMELIKAVNLKKYNSDLGSLELDNMRFKTTMLEVDRIIALGNYYDTYVDLLNAAGEKALDSKLLADIVKTLPSAYLSACDEFKKVSNADADQTVESSKTPTTRFIDVNYIDVYTK